MNRARILVPVLAAIMAAGTGGFWIGHHGAPSPDSAVAAESPRGSGAVIYYKDPDGKPLYSLTPKQTDDGRAWKAVLAGDDVDFEPEAKRAAEPVPKAASGKRILYYRNPMGLPDVSSTPKKDSMGMDYIAVYEGDDDGGSAVRISLGKLQRTGVAVEPARMRVIAEPVRAPGIIQFDERRVSVISLRAEAFVDSVASVTTGSMVHKDEPLMRLYSPNIAAVAAEYVFSLNTRADAAALRGTRQRLSNLSVPDSYLAEIERTKQVPLTFTWSVPRDGIVVERNVMDGQRVMPGDVLFRIADQSVVWALVDVPERNLAEVAEGQPVTVRVRSFPDKIFSGKVALIYPELDPATRTIRVRIELPNPDFLLRPNMYAQAEINTGSGSPVLAVPDSAVIDSGERQIVLIDKGEGRFEPHPVRLGRHGMGYVEIRDGVKDGESVVTSANFLIDAESNLKAALKGLNEAGSSP